MRTLSKSSGFWRFGSLYSNMWSNLYIKLSEKSRSSKWILFILSPISRRVVSLATNGVIYHKVAVPSSEPTNSMFPSTENLSWWIDFLWTLKTPHQNAQSATFFCLILWKFMYHMYISPWLVPAVKKLVFVSTVTESICLLVLEPERKSAGLSLMKWSFPISFFVAVSLTSLS